MNILQIGEATHVVCFMNTGNGTTEDISVLTRKELSLLSLYMMVILARMCRHRKVPQYMDRQAYNTSTKDGRSQYQSMYIGLMCVHKLRMTAHPESTFQRLYLCQKILYCISQSFLWAIVACGLDTQDKLVF